MITDIVITDDEITISGVVDKDIIDDIVDEIISNVIVAYLDEICYERNMCFEDIIEELMYNRDEFVSWVISKYCTNLKYF